MPAKGQISSKRKYRPCPHCSKPFFGPRKYCSDACTAACGKPIPKKNGISKTCEYCGKGFYVPKSRKDARFCSSDCHNEWQGRNKVELICKTCGETYAVSASHLIYSNRKYCSIACRDNDPDVVEMLNGMNLKQQQISPNKLEKTGYALLDQFDVEYIKQYPIAKKFVVDAFIPHANLIVQFDGDYWHGNPLKYHNLDKRQARRVAIDKSQNKYFEKCGYKVLRFWESDIYKRPQWVASSIKKII